MDIKVQSILKGEFRGGALGAEAPPPKFYHVQAKKLLEVAVQMQLHLIIIRMHGQ